MYGPKYTLYNAVLLFITPSGIQERVHIRFDDLVWKLYIVGSIGIIF